MIYTSLANLLENNQNTFGPDCNQFLENSFPIKQNERTWKISRSIQGNKSDYIERLAQYIIQEGAEIAHLNQAPNLITQFNKKWMEIKKVNAHKIKDKGHVPKEILFNSKSESYSWLSNLYPTLIWFHFDNLPPKVYYGAESAYKATKAFLTGKSEIGNAIALSTDLRKIVKSELPYPEKLSIQLMQAVIHSKFHQNRVLMEMLQKTTSSQLVEHTDHPFWGDASSTSCKEKGNGKNYLGSILMQIRD